jgi:[acyl-carrier-protein] S-malonyltransferase
MSDKVCALFAGQSVQETGMGKELWTHKAAREVLERLKPSLGADLEEITVSMPEAELAKTFNAQRAIHACHLGHWFAYKSYHQGLELDGAIGHSMGVVAALVAAGALTVEDSGVFMRARAQAFSDVCKTFAEPMGLAALSTDNFTDVESELETFPGVAVALHNTMRRGTLGGTVKELEALARHAQDQDWPVKIKVLKVEGPYHTKAFAPAHDALSRAAAGLKISRPVCPVFMGTSGKAETDPERIRELLVAQADSRERHQDAVRAAYDAGCRRFVEAAYKPQPVTWLSEQLVDAEGNALPGWTSAAIATADLRG